MKNKWFSKILPLALVVCLVASFAVACKKEDPTTVPGNDTVVITDMAGRSVEIPANLTRVASVFPYVTQIQLALGKGDVLVAIDAASAFNDNLAELYPVVSDLPNVGSAFNINKEALLVTDPQLVITVTWDQDPDKTQSMLGVPVICVDLNYYKDGIEFLGEVLGVKSRAQTLTRFYDDTIAHIQNKLNSVNESDYKRVYVAAGGGAKSTFGAESTWHYEVVEAGGINVAADLIGGGSHDVSMEQIISWDPEVILIDNDCPDTVADILGDSQWQSVTAVKNGQVYASPKGYLDTFGRPHLESVLCRIWAADIFYGDLMGFDVIAEAKDFYSEFYGKDFSTDQIKEILSLD
ncbi:MAG: ABC transporter substrate-binding protein [Dehalococcoidales bacterium]|nr:ABC transporter substrate-binding protein [Dehalococcoidales bacterium]